MQSIPTGTTFSWRGGAQLGGANATYPLVSGTATREAISLSIPAFRPFLETEYIFPASGVTAIRRYVLLPFFAWGVRIHHNLPNYPRKVVLWTFGNPNKLLSHIEDVGFRPLGQPSTSSNGAAPAVPWRLR